MKKILVVFLIIMMFSALLTGAESYKGKSKVTLAKSAMTSDIWIDANRMNGIYRNNGIWLYDPVAGDWGLEWPKGSGLSPMFAAGQWIGAKFPDGTIRVAGIQHSATEYWPGEIEEPFVAGPSTDPAYRWYEMTTSDRTDEPNWPFNQGAPYIDANGNGAYDAGEKAQLLGDQTAFSVWNDLADHAQYGSEKLSVEVRQTVFAFNRADALGDMQFIKWQMVNKSGMDWDSTYFCIWTDPDLGEAGDDLVGCDTTLGIGYCYNATDNDQNYGSAPPSIGIDFFQGPIIDSPGDEVVLPNGNVLADKKMLKMTSFVYYNNEDSPQGNPDNSGHIWNYFRAIWQDNHKITEGGIGTNPANPPTDFMFSGDPESNTGWLDSEEADRRFIMTTGPFSMPAWEDVNGNNMPDFGEPGVQEVVAAVIVGRGATNLNSVTRLKEVDQLAQLAYELNFNLAKAPQPPRVTVSAMPNEVILSWDDFSEFLEDGSPYSSTDPIVESSVGDTILNDIANGVIKVITDADYNFYGYTVYQYSDAGGADPVQLDHWDIGGIEDPEAYTKARFKRILVNKNPKVGNVGDPLTNGKEYYFGVVAEAYLEYGAPQIFQSPPTILTVVPQRELGARYHAAFQDTIETLEHLQVDPALPISDGSALAWVVDPSKVTGDEYNVVFTEDPDNPGTYFWNLVNAATGDTVLKDQTNQRGDDAYQVVDGLLVKVLGPTAGIHGVWNVANGNGPISGWETESGDEDVFWAHWAFNAEADYPTEQAGGGWFFVVWGGGTANDVESFVERVFRNDNWTRAAANVYEMRFTEGTHYAYLRFDDETIVEVPFELWNMGPNPEDTSDDYRMLPATLNNDADIGFTFYGEDPASGAANDPSSDWIYWGDPDDKSPGEAGYTSFFAPGVGNVPTEGWTEVIARSMLMNWNGYASHTDSIALGSFSSTDPASWTAADTTLMTDAGWFLDPDNTLGVAEVDGDWVYGTVLHLPETGTIFRWITNKPNTGNDYYAFTSADAKSMTMENKEADIDKIMVVPNPYYGYHSGELDPFDRWVQFTYLPDVCTIRIFDLAGNLVRRLEKNDPSTTLMKWDLKNHNELPVASGIYVFHVEIPGVGEKVGKIAVFSPNERLDTY